MSNPNQLRAAGLVLRPTQAQDFPFVLTAEQHPENAPFVSQWTLDRHRQALTELDEQHWIAECLSVNSTGDPVPVGYAILAGLENPNRSLELRRLVITQKGQGYGRTALRLLQQWAFQTQAAHRLWLDVMEKNDRARRLYQSEGFMPEGILRECIKTPNGYASMILMSRLSWEWQRSQRSA
ncbi:GNAT family N-acetyltransferase [Romeria aff. gracilis LEGE 07310]|uniref:GNAT family N-acetyltransferase n=1 Tax=Vasconcelosia minhoensis LEGE 07310 TaxID=915328 RepID=A0A8J7ALK0_9CYAN|nr:GNAT family protein [Romeria gracilis]MBE9076441.1 GNAT family N-acetyltransferase [Romeria aff. gracilis LEGE 07310]